MCTLQHHYISAHGGVMLNASCVYQHPESGLLIWKGADCPCRTGDLSCNWQNTTSEGTARCFQILQAKFLIPLQAESDAGSWTCTSWAKALATVFHRPRVRPTSRLSLSLRKCHETEIATIKATATVMSYASVQEASASSSPRFPLPGPEI